MTLCAAAAADHYLSKGRAVAPEDRGIIDIDRRDEGVLNVAPGDPVTIFNLLEGGHRPPLLLEGMLDDQGCYRVTNLRFYVASS